MEIEKIMLCISKMVVHNFMSVETAFALLESIKILNQGVTNEKHE